MDNPVSAPPYRKPERERADEETPGAQDIRQGRIVLRTRTERIIFAAGLGAPAVVLLVLWLRHLL